MWIIVAQASRTQTASEPESTGSSLTPSGRKPKSQDLWNRRSKFVDGNKEQQHIMCGRKEILSKLNYTSQATHLTLVLEAIHLTLTSQTSQYSPHTYLTISPSTSQTTTSQLTFRAPHLTGPASISYSPNSPPLIIHSIQIHITDYFPWFIHLQFTSQAPSLTLTSVSPHRSLTF